MIVGNESSGALRAMTFTYGVIDRTDKEAICTYIALLTSRTPLDVSSVTVMVRDGMRVRCLDALEAPNPARVIVASDRAIVGIGDPLQDGKPHATPAPILSNDYRVLLPETEFCKRYLCPSR